MSDKGLMVAPNVLIENCGVGFTRYRPAFTSIRIDPARNNGRRIEVNEDGHLITFDLSAEEAAQLAALLWPADEAQRAAS